MLFNSIEFLVFLPVVFILYWFVINRNIKEQNFLLLIASYFFYGWWDWRFLSLIIFSSAIDYSVGLLLSGEKKEINRKLILFTSVVINIGFLAFFKYFNFFIDSFSNAFTFFGQSIDPIRLNIILPVGISFYTFQTLSYTIDIYKKKMPPTNDIVSFFAFVSFFPQLVAGPIERASNLLPQFFEKRKFQYTKAVDGLRQILWGLFKKIVIADNCAILVDDIFNNYASTPSEFLVLGAILFSFQIYCDFSGYSDIAIGTARLFGFNLMQNFAFPYFSRNIGEFWRRWHISLSTWFRDYLYIPLGGSRVKKHLKIRNILIIFLVSGFWHGANWTFICWGLLHAIYFLPLIFIGANRTYLDTVAVGRYLPQLKELIQMTITFLIISFSWIFFRAESMFHALEYIKGIAYADLYINWGFIDHPSRVSDFSLTIETLPLFLLFFLIIEWIQREKPHALYFSSNTFKSKLIRRFLYMILSLLILIFWSYNKQEFVYFAF